MGSKTWNYENREMVNRPRHKIQLQGYSAITLKDYDYAPSTWHRRPLLAVACNNEFPRCFGQTKYINAINLNAPGVLHTRHLSQLLHCCGSDCQYCVRDFLRLYHSLRWVSYLLLFNTATDYFEGKHRVLTIRERCRTRYCAHLGIIYRASANSYCITVISTTETCVKDSQSSTALE